MLTMSALDDAKIWAANQPGVEALEENALTNDHTLYWNMLLVGAGREIERRRLSDSEAGYWLMGLLEFQTAQQLTGFKKRRA